MGATHRTIVLAAALAGGATLSQAPEFTQQYRQRLGGAIAEIRQVVADFDRDAQANGLTRDQALGLYAASTEKFLNDRGLTMRGVLDRFERLSRQSRSFASTGPLLRPFALLAQRDARIWAGTWHDFQPALPLTALGVVWAGIGALLGAVLIWLPAPLVRHARRRWQRKRTGRGAEAAPLGARRVPVRRGVRG
jgi:hypothetical protein